MKIIVLDSTAKSIKAVLASSVATSNPDFVVAYADTSDNTFSELSSDGQLNGTTDVTLVGAPASGVKRAIKSITIYNRDTAAVTVSIKFDNGGTQRILQRVQLVSGETWHSDELTKLSPGGSDTQVQFNDTGTLAGSSNFTYNKTTSVLTLGANPVLTAGTANGIVYLNGSKAATTGSALTFDGTTFQYTGAANFATSSGNVGIGTSSPAQKLHVSQASSASPIFTQMTAGANNSYWGWNSVISSWTFQANTGIDFHTGSSYVKNMTLDSSGNLGLGVTPSAWGSGFKAIQISTGGGWMADGANSYFSANSYWNGTNWIRNLANAAARYQMESGVHSWYIAGTGTAGNAITFTQAMTLNTSGNLGVGTTSPTTRLHLAQSNSGNYASVILLSNSADAAADRTGIYGSTTPGNALPYRGGITFWPGDSGTLTFHTGNNASPGDGERARITSGGYLGISTSSPQNYIDLGQSSNGQGLTWSNYSNIFSEYSSGALILSSNYYGNIGSAGYKTAATATFGAAGIQVSGTSGSGTSGLIQFFVDPATSKTAGNAFTPTERARITSGGELLVGTTSAPTNSSRFVQTNGGNRVLQLENSAASLSAAVPGLGIYYAGASPNSTAAEFFNCSDNIATRMTVRSNGGIANYSGNNVNLSDRREKTSFAPAKSYLDTICAIPVQTFNYIDQSEDDPGLTLGVVAQDVQAVAPELVMESNWGTEDNPKMRLSIYQTDLQYALMKCIQEQQALITALTARVAALEGTQP